MIQGFGVGRSLGRVAAARDPIARMLSRPTAAKRGIFTSAISRRSRGLGDLSGVVEDIAGAAKPVMDKLQEVKDALKTSTYASLAAAGLCGLLFLTSLSRRGS